MNVTFEYRLKIYKLYTGAVRSEKELTGGGGGGIRHILFDLIFCGKSIIKG